MGESSDTLFLPLRILYTINSSPQYILARSHKKVSVSVVHRQPSFSSHYANTLPLGEANISTSSPDEPQGKFATASLKTCLDAICCSSPELVQDNSRDFSVYVLDPLESKSTPLLAEDSSVQHPRGVAVGFGLMSWALLADERDSVTVTGTILMPETPQEALEVIFALRETTPMQKSSLPNALKSWGLPPPPSKRSQIHASKSHLSSKHPSSKSKSKSSTSHLVSTSKAEILARMSYHPASQPKSQDTSVVYFKRHPSPPRKSTSADPAGTSETSTNSSQDLPPRSQSVPDSSLASILAALSSSDPNAALLSALSAIDSTSLSSSEGSSDAPNSALVDALRHLLSVACPLPDTTQRVSTHKSEKPPSDDDIVVLDKENVNPGAFRRKTEKEDSKPVLTTAASNRPRPLESKENQVSQSGTITRKRRLSDFMNELEREQASRNKGRNRADSISKRRLRSDPSTGPILQRPSYYRDEHTRPLTSPPRPAPSNENVATAPVRASSPVRPSKPYVVPAWARTTTATQPRFSKEMEEKRQALLTEAQNKKRDASKKDKRSGRRSENDQPLEPLHQAMPKATIPSGRPSLVRKPPKPITADSSLHLPIFASDLSLPPSSPVRNSPDRGSIEFPKTPTCQNDLKTPSTKKGGSTSLFTPTPGSWTSSGSRCLASSASPFSPSQRLRRQGMTPRKTSVDEWDFPSSSLPIASSDDEAGHSQDGPSSFDQDQVFMQHWSGLPPSSPPPPTSPILTPEDSQTDTSDRDDIPFLSDLSVPYSDMPDASNSQNDIFPEGLPLLDDFGTMFSNLGDGDPQFDRDLFDTFPDNFLGDTGSQESMFSDAQLSGTQNGVVDIDFSEFWKTVQPLVDQQADSHSFDLGVEGMIDHSKLATEVQSLFSGCLM